jgi:hypothetical protein
MKRIILLPGLLLTVMMVIHSCSPEFDAYVDELDLAITSYNDAENFGDLTSFYMPDTIVYIGDDVTIQREESSTEQHILDKVRENLLVLGWTEVSDTTNDDITSDVAIMISVLEADINYYYTYWWDYWYWYPWDWWYPVYPGYPIYPIYPVYPSYGYTVGTLIVEMVKVKDTVTPPVENHPGIKLPILWTGMVNGILSGSDANIQRRLTTQIDQIFLQSKYLHKGTID